MNVSSQDKGNNSDSGNNRPSSTTRLTDGFGEASCSPRRGGFMTRLGDGDDEKQYRNLPTAGKYYNRTTELKGSLKKRLPCKDGVGPEKE